MSLCRVCMFSSLPVLLPVLRALRVLCSVLYLSPPSYSFNNALRSVHRDECAEILKTTSRYHRDIVQCWNFGAGCDESCWHSAGRCEIVLGSAAQVVWFDGNEYPETIFPALSDGLFSAQYKPTSALKQILVWATPTPPKTVVHLREGDDASDVRGGLDATT